MLKPNAKPWTIKEQIIEDPVSGLTFQFEVKPCGEFKLRIFGESLTFGNREFDFSPDGREVGAGTFTGLCRPAWLTKIDE